MWPTEIDETARTGDRGSRDIVRLIKRLLLDIARDKNLKVSVVEITYRYSNGQHKFIRSVTAQIAIDSWKNGRNNSVMNVGITESILQNSKKNGFMAHRYPKGNTLRDVYQNDQVYFCTTVQSNTVLSEIKRENDTTFTPSQLRWIVSTL